MPPSFQKLLYKGKKASQDDTVTLGEAGFKRGMKVQMLSTSNLELGHMQAAENEQQRRERILKQRALQTPVKVCSFIKFIIRYKCL